MTASEPAGRYGPSGGLVTEMLALGVREGANGGLWPGLTIYRFSAPTQPDWQEVRGLAIGVVAQGLKAVTERGRRHVYDESTYLVINGDLHFQSEILKASPTRPCVCMVLEVDPPTVRAISEEMPARRGIATAFVRERAQTCVVSAVDEELTSSLIRFLRALSTDADRRVLAPLYRRELVYRVLQRDLFARMLLFANQQTTANPMGAALTYIDTHLSEPITVATLAAQVGLSTSAFTRAFKETTGSSPYQYVKDVRLNRARELVVDQRLGTADIARHVGYASSSHFIKEFRTRFGTTPKDYASSLAAP